MLLLRFRHEHPRGPEVAAAGAQQGRHLLVEEGELVCEVHPQLAAAEGGRGEEGREGVVREDGCGLLRHLQGEVLLLWWWRWARAVRGETPGLRGERFSRRAEMIIVVLGTPAVGSPMVARRPRRAPRGRGLRA